jgi:hypothetical protein
MGNEINKKYLSISKNQINEKEILNKRKNFSTREVGLTHPDTTSFLRLTDNGDIEIFAAPGVGIVISAATRTISFFADNIRFHTKDDGLKWNSMDFNYSADDFTEPALVHSNPENYNPAYINILNAIQNLNTLISEDQEQQIENNVTIQLQGNYLYADSNKDFDSDSLPEESTSVLSIFTEDQISIMKSELNKQTSISITFNKLAEYVANLMQSGYTFVQAKEKAFRDYNV